MSTRSQDLAGELKQVIRLAGRDPEALEGAALARGTYVSILMLYQDSQIAVLRSQSLQGTGQARLREDRVRPGVRHCLEVLAAIARTIDDDGSRHLRVGLYDSLPSISVYGVDDRAFWGEVLVSVEYGEFWRRMGECFEAAGVAWRFYHPHHHHDGREPLALASDRSPTHSGRLGACLARQLDADGGADAFSRIEQALLASRMRLYDQFA